MYSDTISRSSFNQAVTETSSLGVKIAKTTIHTLKIERTGYISAEDHHVILLLSA